MRTACIDVDRRHERCGIFETKITRSIAKACTSQHVSARTVGKRKEFLRRGSKTFSLQICPSAVIL